MKELPMKCSRLSQRLPHGAFFRLYYYEDKAGSGLDKMKNAVEKVVSCKTNNKNKLNCRGYSWAT